MYGGGTMGVRVVKYRFLRYMLRNHGGNWKIKVDKWMKIVYDTQWLAKAN